MSKSLYFSYLFRIVNRYDVKQIREERKKKIFEMYLSCHSGAEIAKVVGVTKETVSEKTELSQILEELPKSDKLAISYQDADFDPPLYNVWM